MNEIYQCYNKKDPGYESRELSHKWAARFHGRIVNRSAGPPGVAVKAIHPGGWAYLRIYLRPPDAWPDSPIRIHWSQRNQKRHTITEASVGEMVMARLKGDTLGQLMNMADKLSKESRN